MASLARPDSRPERFAEQVNALGLWFNTARVIFEGQGPGSDFGGRLVELKYPAVFREDSKPSEKLKKPGLFLNGDSKRELLTEYGRALMDGEVVNRDELALREGFQYEFGPNGLVEHIEAIASPDPSGAKKNHADRWAADALGWHLVKRYKPERLQKIEVSDYSMAAQLMREFEQEREREDFW